MVPQNKKKVMSIRIEQSQYDELREFAEEKGYPSNKFSEYLRSLILSELNAARKGKKLLQIKIKPQNFKTVNKAADSMDIKPEKYVRKLIKSGGNIETGTEDAVNQEEFTKLEEENKKLISKNKELENRISELNSTLEDLKQMKNQFLNQLMFLMKFFQKNGKLLQDHDKKFIMDNRDQFAIIAQQLEGMS